MRQTDYVDTMPNYSFHHGKFSKHVTIRGLDVLTRCHPESV